MSEAPRVTRRQMVLGGALVATSATALVAQPRRVARVLPVVALEDAVPERIGPYRHQSAAGVVLPPDGLSERLYQGYVARTYVAPGLPSVMLLIAYGAVQDFELQLHRPESCYPAFGYALSDSREVSIPLEGNRSIGAVALTATREGVSEQLLYWTRIGRSYPTGFWTERMVILRDALFRSIPDGALVRLSMVSPDAEAATVALSRFNQAMVAGLGPVGRDCLLGRAATPSPRRA